MTAYLLPQASRPKNASAPKGRRRVAELYGTYRAVESLTAREAAAGPRTAPGAHRPAQGPEAPGRDE